MKKKNTRRHERALKSLSILILKKLPAEPETPPVPVFTQTISFSL
jgi:hypothetical protein